VRLAAVPAPVASAHACASLRDSRARPRLSIVVRCGGGCAAYGVVLLCALLVAARCAASARARFRRCAGRG
jgi:hypothetical protein